LARRFFFQVSGSGPEKTETTMKNISPLFPRRVGKHLLALFLLCLFVPFFSACELDFGTVGGADQSENLSPDGEEDSSPDGEEDSSPDGEGDSSPDGEEDSKFERILESMSGVWYSHYGKNRLDGYRIGKFGENGENFAREMGEKKLALFPTNSHSFEAPYPLYQGDEEKAYIPKADDYYLFCDDTVYGENDQGEGGNGGWGGLVTRYAGIVRAVNVFNGNEKTGAIIVQYFQGCAPTWSADIKNGQRPFFGMYYRVQGENLIQMANAIELADLYASKEYYTETATLKEAVEKNNAVNDSEFIAWGVVWPQAREQ
jgi:hypothetical protein